MDNLLFVLDDMSRLDPILAYLQSHLKPYSGKIEEVSDEIDDFLDMKLNCCRNT